MRRSAPTRRGPADVLVLVHPADGWVIEPKRSSILKLFPPAGITAETPLRNLSPQEGSFKVALTSREVGKKVVPGVMTFMVCIQGKTVCEPQIVNVFIEMDVQ